MKLIKFSQLNLFDFRPSSGIYAWYYQLSLGDADIRTLLEELASSNEIVSRELVEKFLYRHVYQYYKEENYKAEIFGKLMPSFAGELIQQHQISGSLTDFILSNPETLWDIKEFLKRLSIDFSSPIYIGMAKNLKSRLLHHKRLIEQFKNERVTHSNFEDRDENFASRVVTRKMNTKNLVVAIQYIDTEKPIQSALENLMNRINYPVLGRN